MSKALWMPIAFFCVGMAFYIYYGVEYNAWKENLSQIIIYVIILLGLHFALRKKEQYAKERNGKEDEKDK